MAFDFKKEYKEFYLPKQKPQIVDVPEMNFIAVRGAGDPNEPDGEYKRAIGVLYGYGSREEFARAGAEAVAADAAELERLLLDETAINTKE